MLKGISPLLGPELLAALCRMGHGDEIVLADAHFPGHGIGPDVIRADGVRIPPLLEAILPLVELDRYVDAPLIMMAAAGDDQLDPSVEAAYREVIDRYAAPAPKIARLRREAFYSRAGKALAIVMTGDTAKYGNIILKKGVTPTS